MDSEQDSRPPSSIVHSLLRKLEKTSLKGLPWGEIFGSSSLPLSPVWRIAAAKESMLVVDKQMFSGQGLFAILVAKQTSPERRYILGVIPMRYHRFVCLIIFCLRTLCLFLEEVQQPHERGWQQPELGGILQKMSRDEQVNLRESILRALNNMLSTFHHAIHGLCHDLYSSWSGTFPHYDLGPPEVHAKAVVPQHADDIRLAADTRSLGFEAMVVALFVHSAPSPSAFISDMQALMSPAGPPNIPLTDEAFRGYISSCFKSLEGQSLPSSQRPPSY